MSVPTSVASKSSTRSIGAILIDAGKLKLDDVERILRLQREKGLRFGDAAKNLKLLNDADIAYALSAQFNYPYLYAGESRVSHHVVAAYNPFSPQVEVLRAIRSQLMLRWFNSIEPKRNSNLNPPLHFKNIQSAVTENTQNKISLKDRRYSLAFTSPHRGDGRSWLVANLGVVFSQLGERTLIIDADLRHPCQHRLFGINNQLGLSALLSGRSHGDNIQRIDGLLDLSILSAGAQPPNPQELIGRPRFTTLLDELTTQYDVILIDTPASGNYADSQTLAARAGGTVIVTRCNETRSNAVRALNQSLSQSGSIVVGTILNQMN
ncbi:MAG: polysaccharide biosynthesis tyrosine autokinase [Pseudomonadota bacterium]